MSYFIPKPFDPTSIDISTIRGLIDLNNGLPTIADVEVDEGEVPRPIKKYDSFWIKTAGDFLIGTRIVQAKEDDRIFALVDGPVESKDWRYQGSINRVATEEDLKASIDDGLALDTQQSQWGNSGPLKDVYSGGRVAGKRVFALTDDNSATNDRRIRDLPFHLNDIIQITFYVSKEAKNIERITGKLDSDESIAPSFDVRFYISASRNVRLQWNLDSEPFLWTPGAPFISLSNPFMIAGQGRGQILEFEKISHNNVYWRMRLTYRVPADTEIHQHIFLPIASSSKLRSAGGSYSYDASLVGTLFISGYAIDVQTAQADPTASIEDIQNALLGKADKTVVDQLIADGITQQQLDQIVSQIDQKIEDAVIEGVPSPTVAGFVRLPSGVLRLTVSDGTDFTANAPVTPDLKRFLTKVEHFTRHATDASNVQLLVQGNVDANDVSINRAVGTVGSDVTVDKAIKKFGRGSLHCQPANGVDGMFPNAEVTYPDIPSYSIGTQEFCIETWLRFDDLTESNQVFLNQSSAVGDQRSWALQRFGGVLRFLTIKGILEPQSIIIRAVEWEIDKWFHIAITRDNFESDNILRLFFNGDLIGSLITELMVFDSTEPIRLFSIKQIDGLRTPLYGHLDDIRITVGHPVYRNSFIPPQVAHQLTDLSLYQRKADAVTQEQVDASVTTARAELETLINSNLPLISEYAALTDVPAEAKLAFVTDDGKIYARQPDDSLQAIGTGTPTTPVTISDTLAEGETDPVEGGVILARFQSVEAALAEAGADVTALQTSLATLSGTVSAFEATDLAPLETRVEALEAEDAPPILPTLFVQPDTVDASAAGDPGVYVAINMISGDGLDVRDETGIHLGGDGTFDFWRPPTDGSWIGKPVILTFAEVETLDRLYLWGRMWPYSHHAPKDFTLKFKTEAGLTLGVVESFIGVDKGSDRTAQVFEFQRREGVKTIELIVNSGFTSGFMQISEIGFRHVEVPVEPGTDLSDYAKTADLPAPYDDTTIQVSIAAINQLLTSDDVDLDTLQEIVDHINANVGDYALRNELGSVSFINDGTTFAFGTTQYHGAAKFYVSVASGPEDIIMSISEVFDLTSGAEVAHSGDVKIYPGEVYMFWRNGNTGRFIKLSKSSGDLYVDSTPIDLDATIQRRVIHSVYSPDIVVNANYGKMIKGRTYSIECQNTPNNGIITVEIDYSVGTSLGMDPVGPLANGLTQIVLQKGETLDITATEIAFTPAYVYTKRPLPKQDEWTHVVPTVIGKGDDQPIDFGAGANMRLAYLVDNDKRMVHLHGMLDWRGGGGNDNGSGPYIIDINALAGVTFDLGSIAILDGGDSYSASRFGKVGYHDPGNNASVEAWVVPFSDKEIAFVFSVVGHGYNNWGPGWGSATAEAQITLDCILPILAPVIAVPTPPLVTAQVWVLASGLTGVQEEDTLQQTYYDNQAGDDAPDTVPQEVVDAANALDTSEWKLYLGHNTWYYTSLSTTGTTSNWSDFGVGNPKGGFGADIHTLYTYK